MASLPSQRSASTRPPGRPGSPPPASAAGRARVLRAAFAFLLAPVRRRRAAADPETLIAVARWFRREHARQILATRPDIARDLMIGRPHLAGAFDDGGLIDVNAVPERILASRLGLSPLHAHHIVMDRKVRGPFGSVDDLTARGLLDAAQLDTWRDVLVVGPAASTTRGDMTAEARGRASSG
jgi:hypothetical protein